MRRVSDVQRGPSGKSLRIEATRGESGFCGVWVHLFDFRASSPKYFDVTRYSHLSLWVKGNPSSFSIRFADRRLVEKEDSREVATPSPTETSAWREILIPLSQVAGVRLDELAAIVIQFDQPGTHELFIDDIAFKTNEHQPTPISSSQDMRGSTDMPSAMWVWNTAGLMHDIAEQTKLFRFCRVHQVDQLWMQLPYERTGSGCTIKSAPELRNLIRHASEYEISVHALDGHPEFSQPIRHRELLDVVDAVVSFNRGSQPAERFQGIHFDNEPYLLVGWADDNYRERILKNFLEINVECQRRASRAGLNYGIDIPFWWHARHDRTRRPIGDVTFQGKRQPASFHCLELFDNVGVMNYRAICDGADGMIAHGRELLQRADRTQHAIVYQGVETFISPPIEVWFLGGLSRSEFARVLAEHERELAQRSHMNGFRLRAWDDGRQIHVGDELPASTQESVNSPATARLCLLKLSALLGQSSLPLDEKRLIEAVLKEPTMSDFAMQPVSGPNGSIPGFRVTSHMLPKITFANRSMRHFLAESQSAHNYFCRFQSHSGLAIHYYESFRTLAEGRE